ncbi:MAG: hypothetical protein AAF577_05345 [Pseudomonadota bacterium]
MTRLFMIAAAAALALPLSGLPMTSAEAADNRSAARVHLADVRIGLRFDNGAIFFTRDNYEGPVYRDDRFLRHAKRKFREERIERRLEGRFVGQSRREIRYGLRDLGFRRIDIDRRGRGFDAFARRNGRDFAFRISRRSGRIVAAERF